MATLISTRQTSDTLFLEVEQGFWWWKKLDLVCVPKAPIADLSSRSRKYRFAVDLARWASNGERVCPLTTSTQRWLVNMTHPFNLALAYMGDESDDG